MPAKTPKTKAKKPKGLKKYYITSNLFNSAQIFDHVKELAFKERATYRCSAPSEILTKEDLKGSREVVKDMQKMISVTGDGEMEVKEVQFTHWDRNSWRFYIQPESLDDLEKFVVETGFEAGINVIDPAEFEDDSEEAWSENQIGMPLPDEPFVVLQLMDAFLEEDEGECGCPECRRAREEGEE